MRVRGRSGVLSAAGTEQWAQPGRSLWMLTPACITRGVPWRDAADRLPDRRRRPVQHDDDETLTRLTPSMSAQARLLCGPSVWHLRLRVLQRCSVACPRGSGVVEGSSVDWLIEMQQPLCEVAASAVEVEPGCVGERFGDAPRNQQVPLLA